MSVNGIEGIEIYATGKNLDDDKTSGVYQLILFHRDTYYILVGSTESPNAMKRLADLKKIADSFRLNKTNKFKYMKLGAFSISLAVKDLQASKSFYESLGFSVFAGNEDSKYLIMKNEDSLIGLFEGMFENNILTFNPGWNQSAQTLKDFDDVRESNQRSRPKVFL